MSWLSDFVDDIEQHTIRPVGHAISDAYDDVEDEIKRSEIAQAALVTTGVVLVGPAVLPVLGSAASAGAGAVGGAVSGAGALSKALVLGTVKTTGNVLSNLWGGITEIFKGKEALPYIADTE